VNPSSWIRRAPYLLLLGSVACDGAASSPPNPVAADGGVMVDSGVPLDSGLSEDTGHPDDSGVTVDVGPPLRVLFVGNSYTASNDLPATVRALAAVTPGPVLEAEVITVPGTGLDDHWATTGARERIMMGGLDVVVLQGQSVETLFSPANFDQHALLFAGLLAEVGARGVWFSTWARRDLEGDPLAIAAAIEARYQAAAAHNGDTVARVGAAWEIWLYTHPEVPLFVADNSHPNAAGTLLTACVMYQALTGNTPQLPDPPPLGVPAEIAAQLCAIAEGGVRCSAGQSECNGVCVPWDVQNCGGCGLTCDPGDPCRRGACGCDPGRTGCEQICVDTGNDPKNCGGCGLSCEGAACAQSTCVCPSSGRLELSVEALAAFDPSCDPQNGVGGLACNGATHRYCGEVGGELSCYNSGFGPPSGHAPTASAVMCVAGDVQTVSYATLAQLVPGCDGINERLGQNCSSAISRYCASLGAVSGFGPVASVGDDLTITCVATATVVHTDLNTLYGFASRCTADPVTCTTATWNYCESLGYAAGFGPVEAIGDDRDVVCLY
jgi:hypothetical protein